MCKETALMRFVEYCEQDPILKKLQDRMSDRIKVASDDEICEIVVDEMFKYHEETVSYYGRRTQDNKYPTEKEREYFADLVVYNLIPHNRIPEDILSADLMDKRLDMRKRLKKLQDIIEEDNQEDNNQNEE